MLYVRYISIKNKHIHLTNIKLYLAHSTFLGKALTSSEQATKEYIYDHQRFHC